MAKIEDLVKRISDAKLREEIAAEVRELKKHKQFGLVFEEHLPELLRLPKVPIRVGNVVAHREAAGNDLWRVVGLSGKKAKCCQPINPGKYDERKTEEFPIAELVLVVSFGDPIYPVLTPVDRIARGGPDKPWHVLINADNYHALQLLLYGYERKVDVIYIDPPYNSGARDWKYNNDYVDKTDIFRNSMWLSMMKKRLVLAKRLLKPDGVLIVTIDENEVHHLGMLLEKLFDTYLRHSVTIVINPKGTGKINFGRTDECALFCVPNTGTAVINGNQITDLATMQKTVELEEEEPEVIEQLEIEEAEPEAVEDADENWDRPFSREEADEWELRHARRRGNESSYRHQRWNQFYPIFIDEKVKTVVEIGESIPLDVAPDFKKQGALTPIWPIDKEGNHRCWRFVSTSMRRLMGEQRLIVGRQDKKTKTWTLNIWEPKNKKKKVKTVWWNSRHDAGTHGTTLLHQLLGRRDAFPFPKSLYAVRDALLTVVGERPNAVVLDFFAGSGTTAHAVGLINAQFGGSRRAIMISNNEPGEKKAKVLSRAGAFAGDPAYEAEGICESVTWPRCKHAFNGKRDDGTLLSGKYIGRDLADKEIKLSDGLPENLEYFRLDFVDPSQVERGDAFEGIMPILWMMAGAMGERESRRGTSAWYLAAHSPFAVLLRETKFSEFEEKLRERKDIHHVFLVTDSEDNFALMRHELGRKYRCVQLYKSYLDNFRVNTVDPSAAGKEMR